MFFTVVYLPCNIEIEIITTFPELYNYMKKKPKLHSLLYYNVYLDCSIFKKGGDIPGLETLTLLL